MLMKDKSIKICPSSGVTFVTQQQPTQQQQQEQQQEVQDAMNNNLPAGGCDDNQEKAVDIPLIFFFAADILLYAIALGKEGSSGWWCTYCDLMKDQWQAGNHDLGNQWTIKSLTEHSNFLTNISDIGKKVTAKERKGVKQVPLFRAIPVSRYITPILHITIGKGNNLLENILEEMQAAAERYSDRYYIKRRELYESQNK